MIKMVSATKVRQNLGHVMNEVALKSDEYIVERAGKPLVAVITPGVLSLTPLAADEEDTKYLVCALEGNADYIISGIPLGSMPDPIRTSIVANSRAALVPGGGFLVYQFTSRVLPVLQRIFGDVRHSVERRNIPPAKLFVCANQS